jgi:predicted metal-dependent HD superfamily phosphohydrolase
LNDVSRWISSLPAEWTEGCSDAVVTTAHTNYQSPGRFYHTWNHVIACVDTLRSFPCDSGRSVFLALLFHDAIYVAGRRDNERRSAELASNTLRHHSTVAEPEVAKIHQMILATQSHQVDKAKEDSDLRAALDIDMSILGASWEQYSSYANGVRAEYCPAVTSEARFVAGRIAFLSKVLASEAIFHTHEGIARWDRAARENMSRELRDLRSGQSVLWRVLAAILLKMR